MQVTKLKDVRIVGCVNPFNDARVEVSFAAGQTVGKMLELVGIRPQFEPVIFINGEPGGPAHIGQPGDLVNFRVRPRISWPFGGGTAAPLVMGSGSTPAPAPQQKISSLGQIAGYALGIGGLAASLLLGLFSKSKTNTKSTEVNNLVSPVADSIPEPDAPPLDGFGGAKDTLLPQWTGVANRENKGGRIARIYGEKYRVFPAVGAHPYTLTEGGQNYLRVVYDYGYGPLVITNRKIGDRPIEELSTNVQFEHQSGKADDADFTLYTWDVEGTTFSSELIYGQSNTRTAQQIGDWIAVALNFPNGLYGKDNNGVFISKTCQINVLYRAIGGTTWTLLGSQVITDNVQTSKTVEYSFPVPNGQWEVSLVKMTADGNGTTTVNKVFWTGLKSWTAKNPFRPVFNQSGEEIRFCRDAVRALATNELSGALGLYSAEAASELRHWNGAGWDAPAISAWPPDIVLDILTGTANYEPVAEDLIDLDRFADWYDFCVEKGLKFNGVFDTETSVWEALKTVCAAGWAVPARINGKISVVVDKPEALPVQLFTPRNIMAGSFAANLNFRQPPDVLKMQFINPDTDWQQDERFVFADGKNENNARTNEVIQLQGVTDPALAWLHGRHQQAANLLRCWTYEFKADIEGIVCTLGDKILLRHDLLFWGLGQARISRLVKDGSNNITGLVLDASQTVETGKTYGIRIRFDDGAILEYQLSGKTEGEYTTFEFSTPIPHDSDDYPERGNLLSFGEYGKDSVPCTIIDMKHEPGFVVTITAGDYAEKVFEASEAPIPPYESNISLPHETNPFIPAPIVTSVQSDETVLTRDTDGAFQTRIFIGIAPAPPDTLFVEYQYKRSSATTWSNSETVSPGAQSISVYGVQDGEEYDVRICNRSVKQRISAWNEQIKNYRVIGKTTPPPDQPNNVDYEPASNVIKWFYDAAHGVTVPADYDGHELRMHWGNNEDWNQALVLGQRIQGGRFDVGGLARGLKTFMLKAVDVAGNYQAGPAAVIKLNFGDVDISNIVMDVPQHPTFAGIKTNCYVSGGKLRSQDDGSKFWKTALAKFWNSDTAAKFWTVNYVAGEYIWEYTPSINEQKPFKVLVDASITGPYVLEYQTVGKRLFWDGGSRPFWNRTPGIRFWGNTPDNDWLPLPTNGLPGEWIKYRFRLRLLASPNQVVVHSLNTRVDVNDLREIKDNYLISDPDGMQVVLSKSFRGIKYVTSALQRDPAHPDAYSVVIVDKNISGPTVQILDSTGAGTTGIVDLIIEGW